MATWVHPGLPRIGNSEHEGRAVRIRSREVFRGSATVFIGKSTSYPCLRRTCCFAPNTCSSLAGSLGSSRGGKRRRHYRGCPAVHWHIDFLVALPSVQDLLFCAKHLFVAAAVAAVHPGRATYWQFGGPAARAG